MTPPADGTAESRRADGPHLHLDVLADLVEGLLDADQQGQAYAHLAHCPVCAQRRDDLLGVTAALSEAAREHLAAPADVTDQIVAALHDAGSLRATQATSVSMTTGAPAPSDHSGVPAAVVSLDERRSRWRRPLAGLAAAAAVVVVVGVAASTIHSGTDHDHTSAASGTGGETGESRTGAPVPEALRLTTGNLRSRAVVLAKGSAPASTHVGTIQPQRSRALLTVRKPATGRCLATPASPGGTTLFGSVTYNGVAATLVVSGPGSQRRARVYDCPSGTVHSLATVTLGR